MMQPIYSRNHAMVKLPEIDTTSSKKYVYLRKNFQQETMPDMDGTITVWGFDEAKVLQSEWMQHLTEENNELKKQLDEQADAIIELASLIG